MVPLYNIRRDISIFIYLIILAIFCSPVNLSASNSIYIPSDTPFFSEPDINSKLLFISSSPLQIHSLQKKRFYLKENPVIKGRWHPIMIYADFHKTQYAPGKFAWVSDNFQYDTRIRRAVPRIIPRFHYQVLSVITFCILLFLLYLCYSKGFFIKIFKDSELLPLKSSIYLLLCIISIRYFLLFIFLFLGGNTMVYPTDENGYFRITSDLISLHISGPWLYTVGQSLFYAPFVYILDANNFLDIAQSFSFFNALIIAPVSICIIYYIIQKLSNSSGKAFIVAFLLAILPFIYYPLELHLKTGENVFKSFFTFPYFSPASYRLYYVYLWTGYNGMSDMPSTLSVLSAIALGLYMRPGKRMIIVISAIFAISCLIRINNIFFSPLIAYIFWIRLKDSVTSLKYLLKLFLIAFTVFTMIFSLQFIANYIFFNSVFTFPYIAHPDDSAKGFLLSTFLSSGSNFIIGCNYMYMVFTVLGLLFIQKHHTLKSILIFWSLPLILFFCGYPVVETSPIRFILTTYGAMLGMIVCIDYLEKSPIKSKIISFTLISLNCLLISPVLRLTPPFQFNLEHYHYGAEAAKTLSIAIPVISIFIAGIFLKSDKKSLIFTITFLLLFNIGSIHLILFLFIIFLTYTLYKFLYSDVYLSLMALKKS